MALEAPARPGLRLVEIGRQHDSETGAHGGEHDLGRDPEAGIEEQAEQRPARTAEASHPSTAFTSTTATA